MATLAMLLLLLAASNAAALSAKAVEYHSFVPTPLSPHPYTAPAADADEDVFGGSLAVAEEDAASAVHFRVVHRGAFAVDATAAELLKNRLQRDKRRAARISKAAAAGAGNAANGTRGVAAPVVSGLAQAFVPPEHASAGRSHEVGSSWPSADPSCWTGPDTIAAHRHGACDWNMARIWAQHSKGGQADGVSPSPSVRYSPLGPRTPSSEELGRREHSPSSTSVSVVTEQSFDDHELHI